MDHLIVDYSLLTSPSSPSSPQSTHQLTNFKSSLSSWGCLQELRDASKQFMGLPTHEKQKYASLEQGTNNGYDCKYHLPADQQHPIVDWNEGALVSVFSPNTAFNPVFGLFFPLTSGSFFFTLCLFSLSLNNSGLCCRALFQEYTRMITPIFEELLKIMIGSLEVDLEKFQKQYGKYKEINMRINHYPICPSTSTHGLGLQAHTDFSTMTFILQVEQGLEVCKDGQWFKVPVINDALFLLLRDPTEIMSNGIFKSALHRTVTSTERSRVSIAMFYDSDRNCNVGPLDDLITASRPQQYQSVSLQHYTSHFLDFYSSGQRLIETIRIHTP